MSILIYMLLAFWQTQQPPSPQVPAAGPTSAARLSAPPPPAACASVIVRNVRNISDQWTVCTVEQLEQRIKQVNPDFLAGKSDIIYKAGQAPVPRLQQKH